MQDGKPAADWGLTSQVHELEAGYLGNRRGFTDGRTGKRSRRSSSCSDANAAGADR
jgi:hypothetical protein